MTKQQLDEIRQRDEQGFSESRKQWSTNRIIDAPSQMASDRHALLRYIDELPSVEPVANQWMMLYDEAGIEIFPRRGGSRITRLTGPNAHAEAEAIVKAHNEAVQSSPEPGCCVWTPENSGNEFFFTTACGERGANKEDSYRFCPYCSFALNRPAGPPPVGNDHVAEGCEKFGDRNDRP